MIKKLLLAIAVLFLMILGVVFTSQFWLPYAIAAGIGQVTGFPTRVQRANLDLPSSKFGIYGLEIKNPKGFPKGNFVSIPEVFVDFDLGPLMKGRKLYIQEIRLNIEEVGIVKNRSGESNISKLTSVRKEKVVAEKQKQKLEKAKSPQELTFFVETLVLTIRRVRFQDEANPLIGERVIDLHVDQEVVHGLSSVADLVRLIVLHVIQKAALGNLGVPVDFLKGHLDASLAKGQELFLQHTAVAREMGIQALGEGERLIEEASKKIPVPEIELEKTVSETAEKAKGILGSAAELLKKPIQSAEEANKS
ncbi:MAG: hypothetical protein HY585_03700 [Candidatus Omnitrophica bacterium]|nr:hypothetical protein [Candidatus Omnitrophota bacterium]